MIVSHKHKFIYIKVRKTAGTSMEIALSKFCGVDDIITPISKVDEDKRRELGFRTAQNYKFPFYKWRLNDIKKAINNNTMSAGYYNHMPSSEVRKYIGEDIWNSYFKFTVDRNPFDKMVSSYYWTKSDAKYDNIYDYIINGGATRLKGYEMYSINNMVAVDMVYKFEDFDFLEKDLTKRLNLPEPFKMMSYRAKSTSRKIKDYKEVFSPEAVKRLKLVFAREIELLGYEY